MKLCVYSKLSGIGCGFIRGQSKPNREDPGAHSLRVSAGSGGKQVAPLPPHALAYVLSAGILHLPSAY